MTSFNRERYLSAAIESVLAQTFTDFELVVVDDCSTDDTVGVVEPYLIDPRVRLVVNDRNLGDYPNRNHAATFARGEFLKYHDSDDVMYPHCLEIMVQALDMYPAAAFALSGDRAWSGGPAPMFLTPRMSYQREFLGTGLFRFGPAAALFRTAAFHDLGRFPDAGIHSDTLFWISACAKRSMVLTQSDLFYYRIHATQELRQSSAPFEGAYLEGVVFRALESPDCPLDPCECEQAKRNLAAGFVKRMIRDLRYGNPRLALYRARHCDLSLREWVRYLRRPRRDASAGTPPDRVTEQAWPVSH
jgi:glycosyltransferase involved in cell wall biosynthesis